MLYIVGNPCCGLGQAQKWGGVKPVKTTIQVQINDKTCTDSVPINKITQSRKK